MSQESMTYQSVGINYDAMDPLKILAQQQAKETSGNIERFGFKVVELSRGESAFIIDEGDRYSAHVIEGLGTKNLVADQIKNQQAIAHEVEKQTGKTYYDTIAQDTIAMIVNDLITVGADPVVVNAYWAVGDSSWFENYKRAEDLATGWRKACDLSGATWGGGETPTLKDIIYPTTTDLAGSAYGIIRPKDRLTLGDKLEAGDSIVLLESSGIHANGLTLARKVADQLPEGYETKLPNGKTYGEALLTPTHIYSPVIRDVFDAGVDIHYMVNITGHGWRKLMRANRVFSYMIECIPQPQEEFELIQRISNNTDEEMYGTFNMNAGFALFVPQNDVEKVQRIALEDYNLQTLNAGYVEEGEKQVFIQPKNIIYKADALNIR